MGASAGLFARAVACILGGQRAVLRPGSKIGDVVATVDPAQTPGRAVRYVLEAKDRRLTLKAALDALDKAIANRDAEAAVMVFAGAASCPVKEPFQWFDHKALVVLDKTSLDPHALRLGCLWARWTACREDAQDGDGIDVTRVHGLLDAARLTLRTASAIQGSHTKAKTAIDQAGRQLADLTGALAATLNELEATVGEDPMRGNS